jgi:hypothetical protein
MSRLRRIFAATGVVLVAMATAVAGAPASAATSTFSFVSLAADLNIQGTDPAQESVVLSTELILQAGESRRVTDQLQLTLSSSEGAEVDNILLCEYLDPVNGWHQVGDRSSSGTNHPGSGGGAVVISNSLLLKAEHTGSYRCQIRSYASDGRTDFYATAVKSGRPFTTAGTWMQISSTKDVCSYQWYSPFCDSQGTLPGCYYLGASGDPVSRYVFDTPGEPRDLWTATNDATSVDVAGTFQITSCPHGSSSCTRSHWGDSGIFGKTKYAVVDTFLEFNQLYPDGSLCRLHQSFDSSSNNRYTITNAVHHLPITYRLTAPVSQNCMGSRTFAIRVYVRWNDGNPVKIDGGALNVINSARSDSTAMVPNVMGATEAQAKDALQTRGFAPAVVGRVRNPAPAGTVIEENSPGQTVEPTGSPVYLTISLGDVTVPYLFGVSRDQAIGALQAVGLVADPGGTVSIDDIDLDGTVIIQTPGGGEHVLPGTTVSLTFGRYQPNQCGPEPC